MGRRVGEPGARLEEPGYRELMAAAVLLPRTRHEVRSRDESA
ncbi:hypothetical protein ABZ914_03875 [Spirillospora sp. NPDC046719]